MASEKQLSCARRPAKSIPALGNRRLAIKLHLRTVKPALIPILSISRIGYNHLQLTLHYLIPGSLRLKGANASTGFQS